MTTATLSPFTRKGATKVGRRVFRKQVLPMRSITYKGRKIDFNKEYLTDLAEAFKAGAYDQVPFVIANDQNQHNENPENFRGEIKGFELSSDGLDAVVEFTEEGASIVEQNPNLGVSARIIEGVEKSDGRKFGRAIRHVLGTMDPVVTGLRPWTAIDLAVYTDGEQVVDLTNEAYDEETDMTAPAQPVQQDKPNTDEPLDLSGLSDAEFDALLEAAEEGATEEEVTVGKEGEVQDKPGSPKEGVVEADLSNVPDGDGDVTLDAQGRPVVKTTSTTTDLSQEVVDTAARDDLAQMRIDLAEERWKSNRKDLVRAGVPPFILDLAEPILASPEKAVIDLSNADGPVNATEIILKMVEGMRGVVDIKPEAGHQVDLSNSESTEAETLLAQWDKEYDF